MWLFNSNYCTKLVDLVLHADKGVLLSTSLLDNFAGVQLKVFALRVLLIKPRLCVGCPVLIIMTLFCSFVDLMENQDKGIHHDIQQVSSLQHFCWV